MNRPVIVIATAIVILIAGLIIYERWKPKRVGLLVGASSEAHWVR